MRNAWGRRATGWSASRQSGNRPPGGGSRGRHGVPSPPPPTEERGIIMIEWNEQQLMIRDMMRRFIDDEIKPKWHDLEHGDLPPYDILRKLMQTFGLDEM